MSNQGQTGVRSNADQASPVWSAISRFRRGFAFAGLFSLFANLLMLVGPLYMMQVYDRVLSSGSLPTLAALTVLAVVLLGAQGLLEAIRSRLFGRAGATAEQALSETLLPAVVRLTIQNARTHRSGAFSDLSTLRQTISGPAPGALFDLPWVPIYLAAVFLLHFWLGFVALVGTVIFLGLAITNDLITRKLAQDAAKESGWSGQFAEASLRHAETLQALGMVEAMAARWRSRLAEAGKINQRLADRSGGLLALSKALRAILQVAILGVGAVLVLQLEVSAGALIGSSVLMGRAIAPVEQGLSHWRSVMAARLAAKRLDTLLIAGNGEEQPRTELPKPEGHLSVEALTVAAPQSKVPLVRGISFQLEPGDVLGIIGPSGAGKTSLMKVIAGVWPQMNGTVRLDGADLRHRPDRADELGYLPQSVQLFDGTVAENISRFQDGPDADIVAAAQVAGAHELILSLPDGYQTRLGPDAGGLSAGQAQRIGLARALYGEPALLLLDEPNANLDQEGDAAMGGAIRAASARGATVLMVTHRPSALAHANKVLTIAEGTQAAFGPREDVLRKVLAPARQAGGSAA